MIKILVAEIAKEKKLSMGKIQRKAQLTPGQISRLWHNKNNRVDLDAIDRLCAVLDVPLDKMLVRES